jgi:hypothetical protein
MQVFSFSVFWVPCPPKGLPLIWESGRAKTATLFLVDVFDREEENLQARVGSVFISKLQWDEKKYGFLGGIFESQRNDIDATFFCKLWPQNDGTMKLILKKGWISRSMMLKRLED